MQPINTLEVGHKGAMWSDATCVNSPSSGESNISHHPGGMTPCTNEFNCIQYISNIYIYITYIIGIKQIDTSCNQWHLLPMAWVEEYCNPSNRACACENCGSSWLGNNWKSLLHLSWDVRLCDEWRKKIKTSLIYAALITELSQSMILYDL